MSTNIKLRRTDGGLIHGYRFIMWVDGRAWLSNSNKPECRGRQYRTVDIALMTRAGKWEVADDIFTSGNQRSHNERPIDGASSPVGEHR